jgi:hypothetical protein
MRTTVEQSQTVALDFGICTFSNTNVSTAVTQKIVIMAHLLLEARMRGPDLKLSGRNGALVIPQGREEHNLMRTIYLFD